MTAKIGKSPSDRLIIEAYKNGKKNYKTSKSMTRKTIGGTKDISTNLLFHFFHHSRSNTAHTYYWTLRVNQSPFFIIASKFSLVNLLNKWILVTWEEKKTIFTFSAWHEISRPFVNIGVSFSFSRYQTFCIFCRSSPDTFLNILCLLHF